MCFPSTGRRGRRGGAQSTARHDRPFVARGSGTGLAGGATPVGRPVVIVTTHLNRILDVDADAPGRLGRARRAQPRPEPGGRPPRPPLRARPVVPAGLHDRRQRRHQRRRPALPRLRASPPPTCSRSTSCSPTARWRGSAASSPTSPATTSAGCFVGSEGTMGIATRIAVRLTPNPPVVRTLLLDFTIDRATRRRR